MVRTRLVLSLRRNRATLEKRVARELSPALGEEDARGEAEKLVAGVALGIERDQPDALRRLIRAERENRAHAQAASQRIEERELAPLLVAGLRWRGRYADSGKAIGRGAW